MQALPQSLTLFAYPIAFAILLCSYRSGHQGKSFLPCKHVETICLVTFVSFKVLDLHFISGVQFPPRFYIYKAITISHVGKHRRSMYCCGQCHSAFLRICPDKTSELIHLRIRVRKHRVRSSHFQGCILCQIRCQFPKIILKIGIRRIRISRQA